LKKISIHCKDILDDFLGNQQIKEGIGVFRDQGDIKRSRGRNDLITEQK